MKHKLAEIDPEADKLLPPGKKDNSGIGVYYVDAVIKPMNTTLEDGSKVLLKRRGARITMSIGGKKGDAIMNRLVDGPDQKNMLDMALKAAAREAGAEYSVENGTAYLDIP